MAKDLRYVPEGFEDVYLKSRNFIWPVLSLEQKMLREVDYKYQPIFSQRGLVMDIRGAAIKK